MNKIKIRNKYVRLGLTIFAAGLALILSWFAIHNTGSLRSGIRTMNDILMPFYVGIVMAYLLCPVYNQIVRIVYHGIEGRFQRKTIAYRISRLLGSVAAVITLIAAIGGFCLMVIPDLWESIMGLIQQMPDTIRSISNWIVLHMEENPVLADLFQEYLQTANDAFDTWMDERLEPLVNTVISGAYVGIIGTFNAVLDVFVALIICVYVLNSKEMFQAQAKKVVLALFKPNRADAIFELGYLTNKTFGGFINGKIIDSIIIGILCFILMYILKLPLATLISVIVGITNIIPFFGPFIGAVPSIVLLLIVDPVAALKFAVLILALQQLDGNVIGPKILGESTGLASFWVMFAIIVGGGLFGFIGMVLGVPFFALFYTYVTRFVNGRLAGKGMNNDTAYYEELKKYDINKEDIFGKERCGAGSCEPVDEEEHKGAAGCTNE